MHEGDDGVCHIGGKDEAEPQRAPGALGAWPVADGRADAPPLHQSQQQPVQPARVLVRPNHVRKAQAHRRQRRRGAQPPLDRELVRAVLVLHGALGVERAVARLGQEAARPAHKAGRRARLVDRVA
eukprot:5806354-Prymnesium_polylepis.1